MGLRIGVPELLRPCSLGDPLTGEGAHVRSGTSPPNLMPNCWVEGSFAAAASALEGKEDERLWWWEEGKERGVGVWVCVGWWVLCVCWRRGEGEEAEGVCGVLCFLCGPSVPGWSKASLLHACFQREPVFARVPDESWWGDSDAASKGKGRFPSGRFQ